MSNRWIVPLASVVAIAFVSVATLRDARQASAAAIPRALPASTPGTSRAELTSTMNEMSAKLASDPGNAAAVVSLASTMIRLQRVNNDGRAVITAEQHLRAFLARKPDHYEARRLLAAVLLSQHRFADAIKEANRTMAADPRDAWNYGAAGDGYIELGDYARAFDAFDRMGQLQPGPASYARTAYALELKGDLEGALEYMRRAAEGTSPNDPESQAWHYAQMGDLLVQLGRLPRARIEFERADANVPGTSHGDRRTGADPDDGRRSDRGAPDAAIRARPQRHARSCDRRWRSLDSPRRDDDRRPVLPDGRADRTGGVGQRAAAATDARQDPERAAGQDGGGGAASPKKRRERAPTS